MAANREELQLVVKAIDEATRNLQAIAKGIGVIGTDAKATADKVETLGQKLSGLGAQVKAGFGLSIGNAAFRALQDGFQALIDLIPDAIRRGNEWARTVDQVQDMTGLGAAATSELLAVMQAVEVPIGAATTAMARFSRNIQTIEGDLGKMGVATRNAAGEQLDAYTILQNLRHRFDEYGASLMGTAAAQRIFGRSGYQLLEFLQLSDEQFRLLADDARAAGLILSDEAAAGAERFRWSLQTLDRTIGGLAQNIFAGLAPSLEVFVQGFSDFLRANMQGIVDFAVNAANFVMGVIGGLLGLDFEAVTLSKQVHDLGENTGNLAGGLEKLGGSAQKARSGEDALTRSIRRQVDAIDAQIRALDIRDGKRDAAARRAGLTDAVGTAQTELNDLKGNSPFLVGLSAAEAELAVQKYNQDILDAQGKLADALAALREHDQDAVTDAAKAKLEAQKRSLQEQLSAHKQSNSTQTSGNRALFGAVNTGWRGNATAATSAFQKISDEAKTWRNKGIGFADDMKRAFNSFLDVLLGEAIWHQTSAAGSGYSRREGGVIGGIAAVGAALKGIGTYWDTFVGWVKTAEGWLNTIADAFFKLGRKIGDFLRSIGLLPTPVNPPKSVGSLQMGGRMEAGGIYKVGEVAAETVYMDANGKGATVYGRPTASTGGGGGSHGHDIYMDGERVARAVDRRLGFANALAPMTSRLAGIGASSVDT